MKHRLVIVDETGDILECRETQDAPKFTDVHTVDGVRHELIQKGGELLHTVNVLRMANACTAWTDEDLASTLPSGWPGQPNLMVCVMKELAPGAMPA